MKKIEFYRDPSGCFVDKIYDLQHPEARSFNDLDDSEVFELFDHLCNFSEARVALRVLMPICKADRRAALRQFIECNWTILDDQLDITETQLNYEYVPCRHKGKGTCPYYGEGVICQISKVPEEMPMDKL